MSVDYVIFGFIIAIFAVIIIIQAMEYSDLCRNQIGIEEHPV